MSNDNEPGASILLLILSVIVAIVTVTVVLNMPPHDPQRLAPIPSRTND